MAMLSLMPHLCYGLLVGVDRDSSLGAATKAALITACDFLNTRQVAKSASAMYSSNCPSWGKMGQWGDCLAS